ncbi:UPF0481 protein At3g47200-like isoform X2 [Salvia miltiorrhiza]|uniref:UPF0481 protein At3g47200-like isoform X2 n=1 Tax=Salvia miltiorrhiza TaxID=226208 RepID=UPI0025AD2655|nr:UPF0481 protein At3g47200-like isoform X2 [Salvia miltiorrhiza]
MLNTTQACCANLNEKLTKLGAEAKSECTIYRVHKHLRNVNPNAYEPEVIAIGPYHRNKDHLKMMEDHKLRYFQHLIIRKPSNNVERYAACVGKWEAEARKCYADEPTSLSPSDFIQMLVLDGCFILELLLKYVVESEREENDPIFQMGWMMYSLHRDLMLFENQLPFFVLCELFDLIEAPGQHSRLLDLLGLFFHGLYPGEGYRGEVSVAPRDVKHLLHFIHRNWLPRGTGTGGRKKQDKGLYFINSAARLKEANIRFKISEPEAALFDVRFKNGVMIMAPLQVEDSTESVLRNLVAYEQYFGQDQDNFVTDYITFLDCLVDSSKDVEILSRNGIVENWLGDEEAVAKMVNKLADSVIVRGTRFIYAEMFENVEKHCRKRRNRWMAMLRRNYLSSPWLIMSLIVGAVLLLLTITQTVCSILQMV